MTIESVLLVPVDDTWQVWTDGHLLGTVYQERQTGTDLRAHRNPTRRRHRTRWVNSRNNADDFTTRTDAVDDLIRIHQGNR